MPTTNDARKLCQQRLHGLLTTLILVADGYHWPGSDGLLIEDVLREYPAVARQGRVPGREDLCREHPDLAQAVADFFDCLRTTV